MSKAISFCIIDEDSGEVACTGNFCVYRIVELRFGKTVYVGSSRNFPKRRDEHIACANGDRVPWGNEEMYMYLSRRDFRVEPVWLYREREKMLRAERRMIAKLRPRFNRVKQSR